MLCHKGGRGVKGRGVKVVKLSYSIGVHKNAQLKLIV